MGGRIYSTPTFEPTRKISVFYRGVVSEPGMILVRGTPIVSELIDRLVKSGHHMVRHGTLCARWVDGHGLTARAENEQ